MWTELDTYRRIKAELPEHFRECLYYEAMPSNPWFRVLLVVSLPGHRATLKRELLSIERGKPKVQMAFAREVAREMAATMTESIEQNYQIVLHEHGVEYVEK